MPQEYVSLITTWATYVSCGVITMWGLICIVNFLRIQGDLREFKDYKIKPLFNREDYTEFKVDDNGYPIVGPIIWCNLIEAKNLRDEYDKISSRYLTWVQNIGIFPLLGILGTIIGLTLNVMFSDNAISMLSSLGTALLTTLLGLVFAIILKFIDSFSLMPLTYNIEGQFESYESIFANLRLEDSAIASNLGRIAMQSMTGNPEEANFPLRSKKTSDNATSTKEAASDSSYDQPQKHYRGEEMKG